MRILLGLLVFMLLTACGKSDVIVLKTDCTNPTDSELPIITPLPAGCQVTAENDNRIIIHCDKKEDN